MIKVPGQIRALLKTDDVKKNLRVVFDAGEAADITSKNILINTFNFSESICSESDFRFGRCESSSITFTAELEENIKGAIINCWIEVDISTEDAGFIAQYGQRSADVDYDFYPISLGTFMVEKCDRQNNARLRKVEAYTVDGLSTTVEYITYTKQAPSSRTKISGLTAFEIKKMSLPVHKNAYNLNGVNAMHALLNLKPQPARLSGERLSMSDNGGTNIDYTLSDGRTLTIQTRRYKAREIINSDYNLWWYDFDATNIVRDIKNKLLEIIPGETEVIKKVISGREIPRPECVLGFQATSTRGFTRGAEGEGYKNGYFDVNLSVTSADLTNISEHSSTGIYFINYVKIEINGSEVAKIYPNKGYHNGGGIYGYDIGAKDGQYEAYPELKIPLSRVYSQTISSTKFYIVPVIDYFGGSSGYDMRSFIEGWAELNTLIGGYSRSGGGYAFKTLQELGGLYPSATLYPATTLYPSGAKEFIAAGSIQRLTYDDAITLPYGKVTWTGTPKGATEEQTIEVNIISDVESLSLDDYLTYDLTANYVLQRFADTYTEAQIKAFCQAVADALKGLQYYPVNVTAQGMPYLEAGDWVEVETPTGIYCTCIMKRTIKNVMNMTDQIIAED